MNPTVRVIDAGPIQYARIDLYGDPDLEHALREEGLDPRTTRYRLVELPLGAISETAGMPWHRRRGRSLLDGVNRAYAHRVLGASGIRAYGLLRG